MLWPSHGEIPSPDISLFERRSGIGRRKICIAWFQCNDNAACLQTQRVRRCIELGSKNRSVCAGLYCVMRQCLKMSGSDCHQRLHWLTCGAFRAPQFEVASISRTPDCSYRRSLRCPNQSRCTHRNTANSFLSWFSQVAAPTMLPKSLVCTPRRWPSECALSGWKHPVRPHLPVQGLHLGH